MAASHGVPMGYYPTIVDGLRDKLEQRETISQVGIRNFRYFLKSEAA